MWETRGENVSLRPEVRGKAAAPTAGDEVIHTSLHRGIALRAVSLGVATGVMRLAPGP